MNSRIFSLVLVACLLCIGLTSAAKPAMAAPVVSTLDAGLDQGGAEPWPATGEETPSMPPLDRDGVVDQPELFDDPRPGTGPADTGSSPPSLGSIGPAAPYLRGLRRPPRGLLSV